MNMTTNITIAVLLVTLGILIGLIMNAPKYPTIALEDDVEYIKSYDPVEEAYERLIYIRDNSPAYEPELEDAIVYLREAMGE